MMLRIIVKNSFYVELLHYLYYFIKGLLCYELQLVTLNLIYFF